MPGEINLTWTKNCLTTWIVADSNTRSTLFLLFMQIYLLNTVAENISKRRYTLLETYSLRLEDMTYSGTSD